MEHRQDNIRTYAPLEPCTYEELALLEKCINGGYVPSSSLNDDYRRTRRAFLAGCDRSVPRLRQTEHCIGCGSCKEHCPQTIGIPAQMQRIGRFT